MGQLVLMFRLMSIPNPFKEWWIFDKIPDDIKTMLRGLYKVPCGYNLLDKKLKENWTRPIS